ncbi:MAG: siroheme synthase CysG [Terracidiphilus sp.]|jgi:uroporphyrin-III C-methyltransferase/precorrin-2 dehydrogenase/sirohydrochlorin ferrochelatase
MNLLPVFLKLDGRSGLVVGAGTVALEKIGSLLNAGLQLSVVAPEAAPEVRQLATEGRLEWIQRPFEIADLEGSFLVIAATDSAEVNAAVYRGAVERGILANSVDDPPHCDFYFGSVVSRGALQIAISTAGESPAVAQRLRREIDEQLPEDLGPWLEDLGQFRREVLATHPRSEARRLLLHQLAQRPVCTASHCPSRQMALAPLDKQPADFSGKIYLIGAGPGDPDLLTVKALRLIQSADVILHDDLVPQAILALASPATEIVNVGKRCGTKSITQEEINELMIEGVRARQRVVRLKSGDPLIFGRAAEEMAALAEAGISFEIVPGITAAFAAAAALGCSLTSRNSASNVIFSTGHHAQSHNQAPLPQVEDATRVVYMPGRDLRLLAEQWLDEGLPPDFPCALISRAAQPDQHVRYTTLATLGHVAPMLAPSLLIAGWALRETSSAFHLETDEEILTRD